MAKPEMAVSMLLKSWATPPASRPTASIRCACRSCSSLARRARSDASRSAWRSRRVKEVAARAAMVSSTSTSPSV
ncbi:MAG TPA: hypothetical protein VF263_23965 [Longimicrobiaceae bacterium]